MTTKPDDLETGRVLADMTIVDIRGKPKVEIRLIDSLTQHAVYLDNYADIEEVYAFLGKAIQFIEDAEIST